MAAAPSLFPPEPLKLKVQDGKEAFDRIQHNISAERKGGQLWYLANR